MASEVFVEILHQAGGGKTFTEELQVLGNTPGGLTPHRSNKGSKGAPFNKAEVGPSPAATPRKSNVEKRDGLCLPPGLDDEDVEAPLGFEPEGSAASSPPYSENITPPHLRWAENLNLLLSDSEGVALFKEFLELEQGGSEELQFWLTCHGLKRKANTDAIDVHNIVKVIFKAYLRSDKVKSVSKDTRKDITDKLSQRSKVDQCIFDEAQLEVEAHLRDVSYPAFLNSDLYVQYVNNYVESPKSASPSGGSPSAAHVSQTGLLPVLHEDKELGAEEIALSGGAVFVAPCRTPDSRQGYLPSSRCAVDAMVGRSASAFSPGSHVSYPAHVSYAPGSAQDSELQSLSSDAHTDDTMSLTDTSSADGRLTYSRRRYRKIMKSNVLQNRENRTDLTTQIIPRTKRAPKDPNLAETNPTRFAQLLIEKLKKEAEKGETVAKVDERLRLMRQGEASEEDAAANRSMVKNTTATFIPIMPQSGGLTEESAESILDFHCSRGPTASSVGQKQAVPPLLHVRVRVVRRKLPPRPHSRKELSRSFDCGACEDKGVVRGETHQHIHHHHHHHHSRGYSGKQRSSGETEQQLLHSVSWHEGPGVGSEHARGRTGQKKSSGRKSAGSGNADSSRMGAVVYEIDPSPIVPNFNNPSCEKVMKWINETVRSNKGANSADTDRSSSTKRSHRHSSNTSGSQAHKQSSKSKTSAHVSNRSASTERGNPLAWGVGGATLPTQPFVQDSSMPLPTPPNPTTQLEEAKRRLQESHLSVSAKSRSSMGVPSKDKGRGVSGSVMPPPSHVPSARKGLADQEGSAPSVAESSPSAPSSRPSRPPGGSSSGAPGGGGGDSVVVGMYYEQEPIPFRFTLSGRALTLEQIKHLNTKRGHFKYFFKRDSDEFGEGAVFEEVKDDTAVVPTWNGKIVAQVQKVE
ncbi:hypothetical protein ACOMHN_042777 [Nucella lapillus]